MIVNFAALNYLILLSVCHADNNCLRAILQSNQFIKKAIMKNLTIILLASLFSATTLFAGTPVPMEIGAKLPATDQVFTDVSGVDLTLEEVIGENGLLVVYTCNSCPYVLAWQDRYPEIAAMCQENGIGLIMLNPNEARRTSSDSFEKMVAHARENNYEFYYALDEKHTLADAMGATKTPDVFLFDRDKTLVYKGAIDDNYKDASAVSEHYLSDAIGKMMKGEEIDPNATKAIGCSIKRVQ
jgi:peroxiredoxin